MLPEALDEMTKGSGDDRSPVAPVDLSQAIIGPGMAVFSKYAAVLEADGTPMSVRTALQLINRFLAEDDFDHDTQFCLHWFEQYGWKEGKFGDADTLARAKGTSVDGVKQAGVLFAAGGVVRLLKWAEYPTDWDPRDGHASARVGSPAPTHPRLQDRRRERCGHGARRDPEQRPKRRGSLPIASTRSASAQAGRRMPAPTTKSSRAGAQSSPLPPPRRRSSRRRLFA